MYMTCKHYLERVLGWEISKLEFLGKKGLKPEIFWLNWWVFVLASVPSWFWTQFAWASPKQASSERAQNATRSWSLKRATLRLSEQHPVQQLLIFRFVHLGTNPNFLNVSFDLVNHCLYI